MKRERARGLLILTGLALLAMPVQAEELKSLRGSRDLAAGSEPPEINRLIADDRPIPRNYVQQPPLIPHETEGYRIDRNYNKCLSCHSWANYKQARATKIPPSHFVDRTGKEMADVSAARYFCIQCHVHQTDTRPLVENEFEPVKALK
jgi:cytochrome c-type protein NapB